MTSRLGRNRDEPLGTKVYRNLVEKLRSGQLASGSRLREEEIAAALDVSRTPVREALARFQARGLASVSSGGLIVSELDSRQVDELYAVRAILEGAAARLAALNAAPADIEGIRHAARGFDNLSDDATALARANTLFHESIYHAARNDHLLRMLEDLNDSLALLPRTTFQIPQRSAEVRLEHAQIVIGIVAKDADKAEKAARDHINKALASRLKLLFSV
jgi:DNA-binding GntR family transcriptional regulator